MMVIKYKKLFLALSLVLVVASLVIIAIRGFNIGIEFRGGSVLEVSYDTRPDISVIQQSVVSNGFDGNVQALGEKGIIVRTHDLSESERQALVKTLAIDGNVPHIDSFHSIGPSIGAELRAKAIVSITIVIILVVLFIAYAFRKVSKPVSSWKYGVVAIITLFHDIAIPSGIFALLGLEVNSLFIVGILSILGLSINDTIVVFDRIRENLKNDAQGNRHESFDAIVGMSLRQSAARSINTSLTVIIVLAILYFFGPTSTQHLALVLGLGMFFGTYSSIFLASPLLTLLVPRKK